jgi:NADP-dependent 3-hydroxy acid dehydrogenase YdfG
MLRASADKTMTTSPYSLSNKVVFVTGAGNGLGATTAAVLAL